MTRRLIVQQFVTLDGYAAGLDDSIDFIPENTARRSTAPGQASAESFEQDALKTLQGVDTILLGRKTYEMFIGYWPEVGTDKELVADRLNSTPKLVFSGVLERAPWGKWDEATVVHEDAVEHVRRLKGEAGKNLILWGSLSLAQTLGQAGLVDEYQLRVCPAVLRQGKTFWSHRLNPSDLEVLEVKAYASGVTLLRYGTGTA